MKIETTAEIPFSRLKSSRPYSSKTNEKLSEIVWIVGENLNILNMSRKLFLKVVDMVKGLCNNYLERGGGVLRLIGGGG